MTKTAGGLVLRDLRDALLKSKSVSQLFDISPIKKRKSVELISNVIRGFLGDGDPSELLINSLRDSFKYFLEYTPNVKSDQRNSKTDAFEDLIRKIIDSGELDEIYQKILLGSSKRLAALVAETNALLFVFCANAYRVSNIEELIDDNLMLRKPDPDYNRVYYRGVTDDTYSLVPSIYRKWPGRGHFQIIKQSDLENRYRDEKLLDKYVKVFGSKQIDVAFCSFIQHAASYSPFLDITADHIVALSFATKFSGGRNEYNKTKAAIYRFEFNRSVGTKTDNSLLNHTIHLIPGKLTFSSSFSGRPIFFCSPSAITLDIEIIDQQNNDRMRYQRGAFLYFSNGYIVNDVLLLPYHIGRVHKYIISPQSSFLKGLGLCKKSHSFKDSKGFPPQRPQSPDEPLSLV